MFQLDLRHYSNLIFQRKIHVSSLSITQTVPVLTPVNPLIRLGNHFYIEVAVSEVHVLLAC